MVFLYKAKFYRKLYLILMLRFPFFNLPIAFMNPKRATIKIRPQTIK